MGWKKNAMNFGKVAVGIGVLIVVLRVFGQDAVIQNATNAVIAWICGVFGITPFTLF